MRTSFATTSGREHKAREVSDHGARASVLRQPASQNSMTSSRTLMHVKLMRDDIVSVQYVWSGHWWDLRSSKTVLPLK